MINTLRVAILQAVRSAAPLEAALQCTREMLGQRAAAGSFLDRRAG